MRLRGAPRIFFPSGSGSSLNSVASPVTWSPFGGATAVFEFLQGAAAIGGPAAMGSFGQYDSLISDSGYDVGGEEEVAAKGGCSWHTMYTTGEKPMPRCGHTLTIIGRHAIMVGGCGAKNNEPCIFGDVYILDLVDKHWMAARGIKTIPLPKAESSKADSGPSDLAKTISAFQLPSGSAMLRRASQKPITASSSLSRDQRGSARVIKGASTVASPTKASNDVSASDFAKADEVDAHGGNSYYRTGESGKAESLLSAPSTPGRNHEDVLSNTQTPSNDIAEGAPPSRWQHTVTAVDGSNLAMFGGLSGGVGRSAVSRLKDFWVLDVGGISEGNFGSITWKELDCKGGPAARSSHSACLVGGKIWVFGGYGGGKGSRTFLGDLHCVSPGDWTWGGAVATQGKGPSPRAGHTCNAVDKDMLVVMGGRDITGLLSDIHVLHLDDMRWSELRVGTPNPTTLDPLCNHLAAALDSVPSYKIFVYGGQTADESERENWGYEGRVRVLDCHDMVWGEGGASGIAPPAREQSAWAYDAKSARIVMFGGWADEWLNDLVALDVSGVVGPPYAVQSLHPAQGPVTGGTLVSIIGSDFVKPPEGVDVLVKFVGESGEEVVTGTYVNHEEVTCHAPSWEHHSSGSGEVDVRVSLGDDGYTVNRVKYLFYINTRPQQCIAFGPGLAPTANWGIPARFRIQAKDSTGANRTSGMDGFIVRCYSEKSGGASFAKRHSSLRADLMGSPDMGMFDSDSLKNSPEKKIHEEPQGDVYVHVEDHHDGSYTCSFTPKSSGTYELHVKLVDHLLGQVVPIRGSPWRVTFTDPWQRNVKVIGAANAPSTRDGLQFAHYGNRLVAWGGSESDLHVLDTGILRWETPSISGEPPVQRTGHNIVPLDREKFMVFGGRKIELDEDGLPPRYLGDTWMLLGEKTGWKWQEGKYQVGRDEPAQRANAAACLLHFEGDADSFVSEIAVHGGELLDGVLLREDAFLLQCTAPSDFTFRSLEPGMSSNGADYGNGIGYGSGGSMTSPESGLENGEIPFGSEGTGRAFHGLASLGRSKMLLFGGDGKPLSNSVLLGVIDQQTGLVQWQEQQCKKGTKPCPRVGFLILPREEGRKVYVYGGRDSNGKTLDDLWLLDTENFQWSMLYSSSADWLKGKKTVPVLDGERLLLVCGQGNAYDEIHVLEYAELTKNSSVLVQASAQVASDLSDLGAMSESLLETIQRKVMDESLTEEERIAVLIEVVGSVYEIKKSTDATDLRLEVAKESLTLLETNGIEVSRLKSDLKSVQAGWARLKDLTPQVKEAIKGLELGEKTKLHINVLEFIGKVEELGTGAGDAPRYFRATGVESAYEDIEAAYASLQELQAEHGGLEHMCRIFECEDAIEPATSNLKAIVRGLVDIKGMWDAVMMIDSQVVAFGEILWAECDISSLEHEAGSLRTILNLLPQGVKSFDVFKRTEEDLTGFLKLLPLLRYLKHSSMKERHWDMVKEVLRVRALQVDSPTFRLKDALRLDLVTNEAELNEVVVRAQKEEAMEATLKSIADTWRDVELQFVQHKDSSVYLAVMSEGDEVTLEEHQLQIQDLAGSRYLDSIYKTDKFGPITFAQDVSLWHKKLFGMSEILGSLAEIQKSWSYLETLFIGSEEVRKELPDAAADFAVLDRQLKGVFSQMQQTGNVEVACSANGLADSLQVFREQLEVCEKALANFLESKKVAFGRFYFLSNADLLDILSNGNTPHKVMHHMHKFVSAVSTIELTHGTESEFKGRPTAVGWVSQCGHERVDLSRQLFIESSVEQYLAEIIKEIGSTLKIMTHKCIEGGATALQNVHGNFPGQVLIVASMARFGLIVEQAFAGSSGSTMQSLDEDIHSELSHLCEVLREDNDGDALGVAARQRVSSMIVLACHQSDVVERLEYEECESEDSFIWQSQLRFAWRGDIGGVVRCHDVEFRYGYEYWGLASPPVITPLTERAFVSFSRAIHSHCGSLVHGPSGVGRSETIRGFSMASGRCFYSVSCGSGSGHDYASLCDVLKGLGSAGAVGYLTALDKLSPGVLSAVASQVASLFSAMRSAATTFEINGSELPLRPSVSVLMSLSHTDASDNGTWSASALPYSLSILLRPASFIVPDTSTVCEGLLFARGFAQARVISVKIADLHALCSDLMPQRPHYDWSLRSMRAVIEQAYSLGRLKRDADGSGSSILSNGRGTEEAVASAIYAFNFPRIYPEDVACFQALLLDLFPSTEIPLSSDEVSSSAETGCKSLGLQPADKFLLHNTAFEQAVSARPSVALIGPASSGKTSVMRCVAASLGLRGERVVVREVVQHAVSLSVLYGSIKEDKKVGTREWSDGLIPSILREYAGHEADASSHRWLHMDGSVDPTWIEGLLGALDGDRVINLSSSERIFVGGMTRVVFECEDLTHASPQTVSRMGVVHVARDSWLWGSQIKSWLEAREDTAHNTQQLASLFQTHVRPCLEYMQKEAHTITPIPEPALVDSLLKILDALLSRELRHDVDPAHRVDFAFSYAISWAFALPLAFHKGADQRRIWSQFIRGRAGALPMPNKGSVLDHFLVSEESEGIAWVPWATSIKDPADIDDYQQVTFRNVAQFRVPTVDSVISEYFAKMVVRGGSGVMLVGHTGVGKTQLMAQVVASLGLGTTGSRCKVGYETTARRMQELLESRLEKKAGKNYSPPGDKRLIYCIDDVSMPRVDRFGNQAPLELLRQAIERSSFYDSESLALKVISGVSYMASLNPTAGSFRVGGRLQRHFVAQAVDQPSPEALSAIFGTIVRGHFEAGSFDVNAGFDEGFASKVVQAGMELHRRAAAGIGVGGASLQRCFSMRDLTRVYKGMFQGTSERFGAPHKYASLMFHEFDRVYGDSLTSQQERAGYQKIVREVLKRFFKDFEAASVLPWPHICTNYTLENDKKYDLISSVHETAEVLRSALSTYWECNDGSMITLFDEAVRHVCRITRLINLGHALLIGPASVGKRSIARLGCFLSGFNIYIPSAMPAHHTTDSLKSLIADAVKSCGLAGMEGAKAALLLEECHFVDGVSLSVLGDLLEEGPLPDGLFSAEEKEHFANKLAIEANSEGAEDREAVYGYFTKKVRQNLRVVMCMDSTKSRPSGGGIEGGGLRQRCERYPELRGRAATYHFMEWEDTSLLRIAEAGLSEDEAAAGDVVKAFPFAYRAVQSNGGCGGGASAVSECVLLYNRALRKRQLELQGDLDRTSKGVARYDNAQNLVESMEADLTVKSVGVDEQREECDTLMARLGDERRNAEEREIEADEEDDKAKELQKKAEEMKIEVEADLAASIPAGKAIDQALSTINVKELAEMKSQAKPPSGGVEDAFAACLALMGEPPKKRDWASIQKVLSNPSQLIADLKAIKGKAEVGKVQAKDVDAARPYLLMDHFRMEVMARRSRSAGQLVEFVTTFVRFYELVTSVEPKRKALALSTDELKAATQASARLRAEAKASLESLEGLESSFRDAVELKNAAVGQAQSLHKALVLAQRLMASIKPDCERWRLEAAELKKQQKFARGDAFTSAVFVSMCGPLTPDQRSSVCLDHLSSYLATNGIPSSPLLDPAALFMSPRSHAVWGADGLPADRAAVQSACIVASTQRVPLIVDPEGRARAWLLAEESRAAQRVVVAKAGHGDEDGGKLEELAREVIKEGWTLVLEGIEDELGVLVSEIVTCRKIKEGRRWVMKLGREYVEVSDRFRIVLVSPLPSPSFAPQTLAVCNLISFIAAREAAEELMLTGLLRSLLPSVESEYASLRGAVATIKGKLHDLQRSVLGKINDAEGEIIEDASLIEQLEKDRTSCKELIDRCKLQEARLALLTQTRESYRPVAKRGALLHSLAPSLAALSRAYIPSLAMLYQAFVAGVEGLGYAGHDQIHVPKLIKTSKKKNAYARFRMYATMVKAGLKGCLKGGRVLASTSGQDAAGQLAGERKVEGLVKAVTGSVYRALADGMMVHHSQSLACAVALKAMLWEGEMDEDEVKLFVSPGPSDQGGGGGGGGAGGRMAGGEAMAEDVASVLRPSQWDSLVQIQECHGLSQLCVEFEAAPERWKSWMSLDKPEHHDPPGFSLDALQRLLIVKALRPDRLHVCVQDFIASHLGPEYTVPSTPLFSIASAARTSAASTPILVMLLPGGRAEAGLVTLETRRARKLPTVHVTVGRGGGADGDGAVGEVNRVLKIVREGMKRGSWVMIEDVCDVAAKPLLLPLLDQLAIDKAHAHKDFRLWLIATSVSNDTSCIDHLPSLVLYKATKVACQAPTGLVNHLSRSWARMLDVPELQGDANPSNNNNSKNASLLPPALSDKLCAALFGLCVVHSQMIARRNFIYDGWSHWYDFGDSELDQCRDLIVSAFRSAHAMCTQDDSQNLTLENAIAITDIRRNCSEAVYGSLMRDRVDRRLCRVMFDMGLTSQIVFEKAGFGHAPGIPFPSKLLTSYADFEMLIASATAFKDARAVSRVGADTKELRDGPEAMLLARETKVNFRMSKAFSIIETTDVLVHDTFPSIFAGSAGQATDGTSSSDTLVELLDQLPTNFGFGDLGPDVGETPFSAVFLQEGERMNALMTCMRSSLLELQQGLKGIVNITDSMRATHASLAANTVPVEWTRLAYPSMKPLSAWFIDLLLRIEQVARWRETLRLPASIWISGFFRPHALFAAARQTHSRKIGVPISEIELQYEVTPYTWEGVTHADAEAEDGSKQGIFVHGLFLQGAGWDTDERKIVRSAVYRGDTGPTRLPVMKIQSLGGNFSHTFSGSVEETYPCPVYQTRSRGDSYVAFVDLPTSVDPTDLVCSGLSLVMSL